MSNLPLYYLARKGVGLPETSEAKRSAAPEAHAPAKGGKAPQKEQMEDLEVKCARLEQQVRELTNKLAILNTGENKGKKKNKGLTLQTPKGTVDYGPQEMAVRERVISTIVQVFKMHGAQTIDTPVFELKELLTNKYGEDSKLIYDLKDQGGQDCSLRYDLTVPFARFLAMKNQMYIKRYHIGKVYRRDQPSKAQGRLREFTQCDFDIAGEYSTMVEKDKISNMLADSEVLSVAVQCLENLEIGNFNIKVNHRNFLDGMFAVCGVPTKLFRPICSAVDKLDKLPWEEVKMEMISKGLNEQTCDKIWNYVQLRSESGAALQLVEQLKKDADLMKNKSVQKAMKELTLLFEYVNHLGCASRITFDLSLARGLDYYTGMIFEGVLLDTVLGEDQQPLRIGSIAGGGRYDNLVGSLGGKKIPCVGFSLGMERIFVQVERLELAKDPSQRIREYPTNVVVCPIGPFVKERLEIVSKLWQGGIYATYPLKSKIKIGDILSAASKEQVPLAVMFGEDELKAGKVKLKDLRSQEESFCPLDELVDRVKSLL